MSPQPSPVSPLIMVPLKIADELRAASIPHGGPFYLVYDQRSQRFSVVWWERLRWQCSCTKAKCAHVRIVSTFLLEKTSTRPIPVDDLPAHVEDDVRLDQ
jgi:hypothetical protein